jgi:voltage-gated potassium channel
MVIIVIEFGGMGIVYAEAWHPDANIKTGGDGAWWSFVSITTVGYGDRYPVTPVGRIIGLVVLTVGVSTYGVLSGFLANAFFPTGRDASEERIPADNTDEITDLRALLEEQAKLNQALRKQLDQLERSNEDEAG